MRPGISPVYLSKENPYGLFGPMGALAVWALWLCGLFAARAVLPRGQSAPVRAFCCMGALAVWAKH